tara:strand:- start:89 stop:3583 length:3495 start_codon:yes stop_codon:yes gene_type:complete
MAEQTFRSPGFFETEIDLSQRTEATLGTPAGIIGTSDFGPAFVPVTIGSFADFKTRFGGLNPDQFGPYAVNEFLKRRSAVTYMRVLGAGANSTTGDISNFESGGIVKNAGFKVAGVAATKDTSGRVLGTVQFLSAKHTIPAASDIGFPVFTDNDSFPQVREKNQFAKAVITFGSLPGADETLSITFGNGNTAQVITFSTGGGTHETSFSSNAADIQRGTAANANGTATAVAVICNNVSGFTASASGAVVTITADTAVKTTNDFTITTTISSAPTVSITPGDSNTATADTAFLIRAGLMTTTGSSFFVLDSGDFAQARDSLTVDTAKPDSSRRFKLALYRADIEEGANGDTGDAKFGKDDGINGMRVFTASLDPNDPYYISNILNTNPDKFQEEQHLLYWDFPVEDELASVKTDAASIAIVSGSDASSSGGVTDTYNDLFGRFDTRYSAPKTTKFISQPFGTAEFDLFHFESLSDGAYANDKYKISIADVKASKDPNNDYGTFEVQVRKFGDSDLAPEMVERFPGLSLDPTHERYIARVIGDFKVRFNFDETNDDERRLVLSGKYPNKSSFIRVQMSADMQAGEVPDAALPFGFRGIPALYTSPNRQNPTSDDGSYSLSTPRLNCTTATTLTGSIVPPLPFRYKVTKGATHSSPVFSGEPGLKERADARFYWGVKNDRIASGSSNIYNANGGSEINNLVRTYTKLQGIQKMDAVTANGAQSDAFHNHKFTLARVALRQQLTAAGQIDTNGSLTGSAGLHMKEAVYIRNGSVDPKTYTVRDPIEETERITFASLVNSSSLLFNRFTGFAKFTNIFYGGFDGLNILDRDCARMNDRAASTETGGKGGDSITNGIGLSGGDNGNLMGSGKSNNVISSYRTAVEIMTDEMTVRSNILAIPGIRDPYITDFAADRNKDYQMSIYLMDIPNYDEGGTRLFDDDSERPGVDKTSEEFTRRVVDNNYAATYFPDVFIEDAENGGRRIKVPSSIAALGALAFTDSVAYPWFAPAGFNRGGIEFVKNVTTRLTTNDRDVLYDARINPIATFPGGDFVIFGQKTLQIAASALDRVNVRRMMLELKRQVIGVANNLLFEQNNQTTRNRFINLVSPRLSLIQAQQGIESFRVVMDDTNNTERDREANRLNGKIIVVPTRTIEFIAIDFIITNAGVSFE